VDTCEATGAAGFMPAHDSPQPLATIAQKAPDVTTPAMCELPMVCSSTTAKIWNKPVAANTYSPPCIKSLGGAMAAGSGSLSNS
jgi:hypothetical protein